MYAYAKNNSIFKAIGQVYWTTKTTSMYIVYEIEDSRIRYRTQVQVDGRHAVMKWPITAKLQYLHTYSVEHVATCPLLNLPS